MSDELLAFVDAVLAGAAANLYTNSVWAGLAVFFAISALRP